MENDQLPPDGTPPTVVFDDAQQSKVNAIVLREKANLERKLQSTFETEKADFLRQIEELKKPKPSTGRPGEEDAEALKGKVEEFKNLLETEKSRAKRWEEEAQAKAKEALIARSEAQLVQKRIAMSSAAAAAKFRNPEHAVSLSESNVKWDADHNKFIVLGDHGQPRMNNALEEMSLEEYFKDFASKNPYMVQGSVIPGFGTTPGAGPVDSGVKVEEVFGKGSSAVLAQQLKRSDPVRYAALRKVALAQGRI